MSATQFTTRARASHTAAAELVRMDLTPQRPLSLCVEETPDEGKTHAHMHLALEIGVLLSGSVMQDQGRGWFRLRPGQFWACGLLEVHRWRVLRRAVEVRFDFLPSLLVGIPSLEGLDPTAVFRSAIRTSPHVSGRAFRRSLLTLGRELAAKCRQGILPGQAYVGLLRLLELVGAQAAGVAPLLEPWCDLASAARVQPALEMIEQSPDRRVGVPEAARACRMARSTFDRLFKQVTGFGFAEFALRRRLALAAQFLKAGVSPVKAVALRFGFEDASHFHHAFVAHYGIPPGQYGAGAGPRVRSR
jgi:AraC-like DNA-binding protein